MQSPVHGRCCIDIRATYKKHNTIAPDLLSIHAISGCDTVAATYGIGKMTALNIASKGYRLHLLGDESADISKVVEQATSFMAACYGIISCSSMTECRQLVWAQKTSKSLSAPKLCSLPPTSEAFKENLLRAHLQVVQWQAALTGESPAMDPMGFGWEADQQNKSLIPRNMSSGTPYAPEHVLKIVRCGCQSERSCRGGNCGCMGRRYHARLFVLACKTACAKIHSTNHMKKSRRDESWNHIYHEIIVSINHTGYHTYRWIGLVCICWMMTRPSGNNGNPKQVRFSHSCI